MASYTPTVLDDQRLHLQGPVLPGAKWPCVLRVRVKAECFKGYTSLFLNFQVRTQIPDDKNKGLIEGILPLQEGYAVLNALANISPTLDKPLIWNSMRHIFTKQGRSPEAVLTNKVVVGIKDNQVYLSVTDAMDGGRAKPLFFFGFTPSPRGDHATTTGDKLIMSTATAGGWAGLMATLLTPALADAQQYAVANDKNPPEDKAAGGGNRPNNNSNSNKGNGALDSADANDSDDDLPF